VLHSCNSNSNLLPDLAAIEDIVLSITAEDCSRPDGLKGRRGGEGRGGEGANREKGRGRESRREKGRGGERRGGAERVGERRGE